MLNKIILASKSKVRKEILDKNNIKCDVVPSNVDEDIVKNSLLKGFVLFNYQVILTEPTRGLNGCKLQL